MQPGSLGFARKSKRRMMRFSSLPCCLRCPSQGLESNWPEPSALQTTIQHVTACTCGRSFSIARMPPQLCEKRPLCCRLNCAKILVLDPTVPLFAERGGSEGVGFAMLELSELRACPRCVAACAWLFGCHVTDLLSVERRLIRGHKSLPTRLAT